MNTAFNKKSAFLKGKEIPYFKKPSAPDKQARKNG